MAVETPGAPRWGKFRDERLREWFEKSPFYAGSPLASVEQWRGEAGLYALRDGKGRVCCVMRGPEIGKAVSPLPRDRTVL